MTDWATVYLGLIAAGVVVMAVLQVGISVAALVYGRRLARRVDELSTRLDHELKPLFLNVQTVGAEAARASALAAAQVERADQLFAEVSRRIDETTAVLQHAVVAPAREGMALVAAIRAAVAAIRGTRTAGQQAHRPARSAEDDPLFIG